MYPQVNPKQHVAPGTSLHSFVGWTLLVVFGPLLVLATVLATYGIALIAWIAAVVLYAANARKARARLHGSAIRVQPGQFTEIHQAAVGIAEAVGLRECPDIYIVEDNLQNAVAFKHGSRHFVVLMDDIVHGALATGNEKALHCRVVFKTGQI